MNIKYIKYEYNFFFNLSNQIHIGKVLGFSQDTEAETDSLTKW